MKHALNATDIKRTNQRLILDAIFKYGTTSRTQLAQALRLSKPAISDNLQPLLDLGIVTESGESNAGPSGGRKSILLQFNPQHRNIIAVNLNFSNPVFVLADLNGNILNAFDITIAPGMPIAACSELVISGIRMLLQSLGTNQDRVSCIAVAAPGVFNSEGELTAYSTSCGGPAWWKINLKETLTDAFPHPVILYNDVKAATLGEWERGAGEHKKDMFYISVGLGIGSGVILDGKPLLGKRCNAGEIYDYIDSSNVSCGMKLEDTICMEYLQEQCLRAPASPFLHRDSVSFQEILLAYKAGDASVHRVVEGICRRLAIITYNYINFISIDHVVFGGEYAPFVDCFAQQLSRLYPNSLWPAPEIRISALGKHAGIQGLVCLAREQYFRQICDL